MAQKFLSNIELEAGLVDVNGNTGTSGQILSSTGSGVDWIPQSDIVSEKAQTVTIRVKNSTASAMTKGQVVCEAVSASPPSGNLIEVALADNNGTNTMPALGILNEDLDAAGGANDEGDAVMFGKVSGINTSAFSVGDEVFVDSTPGGLTITKPTGVKYIQKVGVVIRDDATNGTIEVFGAGRVNDVPTPLYVNHLQQRLGVGVLQPNVRLDVSGNAFIGSLHSSTTIGQDATAIGQENEVSGFASFAGNQLNVASGAQSAAFNYSNTASGGASFATGSNNTVSGVGSFSNGNGNTVSGNYSGSFGASNTVSGNYGFNSGENNEVKGNWNTAFGFDNFVEGGTVTAVGCNAVLGRGNEINSQFSGYNIVGGLGNTLGVNASSNDPASANIVGGAYNTNYWAENCLIVGGSNTIGSASVQSNTGTGSIMGGYNNFNNGSYSIVSGYQNTNFSNAGLVLGLGSVGSTGDRQFAIGEGVTTPTSATAAYISNQFVVGQYNEYSGITTGHLFAVGNGASDTNRSTAFCVLPNGNVGIDTNGPKSRLHVTNYTTSGSLPSIDGQTLILAESIPVSSAGANISVLSGTSGTASISFGDSAAEKRGAVNYLNISDEMRFRTAAGDRVTIKSDGDVGIGTTDPGVKLDVIAGNNNGIRISSEATSNPWKDIKVLSYVSESQAASFSDGSHIFTTNPSGATTWPFTEYGALVIEGRDNNNGGIALRTGTGTGLATRVAIREGGNVGIGTTDPVTRTHIYGPNHTGAFNTGALMIQQSSDNTRMFIDGNDIDAADGILFLNDYSQNPVRLGDDLQVPNGSIGVGFTTAPSARVHAGDGGTVPSIDAGTMFLASNTSATGDYSSMSIISGTAGIASLFFGDTDAEKRGAVRYLNSTDEMRFRTANTDRVTIKGDGDVGIGTTNPSEKLEVEGSVNNDDVAIRIENTYDDNLSTSRPAAALTFATASNNGYLRVYGAPADTAANHQIDLGATATNSYLTFSPNNSEKMRIASNGFVGINTTDPGYHLDVNGEARIGSISRTGTRLLIQAENTAGSPATTTEIRMLGYESRGQGIFFQDSGNSGEEWFAGLNYNGNWDKYSIGYDASGGQAEYVTNAILTAKGSNASVGIGTTDPTAKLDIDNIGNSSTGLRVSAGTNTQFAVETGSTNDGIVKVNGLDANTRVYLNGASSGFSYFTEKLGVGKSSDIRANLDVEGPVRVIGGTFTSGTSGADSQSSAGIVLRRGKRILSGIPNGTNEDFYLRSLLEQTTSGNIVIGQSGTSLIGDMLLKPGASGNIIFYTINDGNESMRVDSSGDVGIGTTNPQAKLDVDSVGNSTTAIRASAGTNTQFAVGTDSTNNGLVTVHGNDGIARVTLAGSSSGTNIFKTDTSFGTSNVANGRYVYIEGTTSTTSSNLMAIKSTTAFTSTPGRIVDFINSSNTVVGRILMYGSAVQYSTSSDYRLKENVEDITNGIDRVKQLKPKKFNFINEPSRTIDGFLAHEVDNIVPGAVDGEKDAVDEEGNPIYQGIDQSKMVPLLTAALQEAITKIEQLESRIQTLENN